MTKADMPLSDYIYHSEDSGVLYQGDCLDVMAAMPDNSIDLIAVDPPYFKVKNAEWDRQWNDPEKFLEWIGQLCEQWHRLLRPNGSLYVFASPKMSARVESAIAKLFYVLNRIRWTKEAGWHRRAEKEVLRSYLSPWEEIIFAEHYGADSIAKGVAGYAAKRDRLRGFVFEPLRAYLATERDHAGWTTVSVAEQFQRKTGSRTVTGMAGHWFSCVQWTLPTRNNYDWLRSIFNHNGTQYLRREYEELRREYEELRRPFNVDSNVPYTDVWTFPTVQAYRGKHPCQKPVEMMEHIICASSRPDAVVLDCLAGSGTTGIAAKQTGRRFILIEKDPEFCEIAKNRLQPEEQLQLVGT